MQPFGRQILLGLLVIVIAGSLAGWMLEKANEREPPIVFVGSGNVWPFLKRGVPNLAETEPLWLDIPSGDALHQAFTAFDYGRSLNSEKRVGFIAMSSNGTGVLAEEYEKADKAFQKDNYWLALIIAHPPLAIVYRGIDGDRLPVSIAATFPPEEQNGNATKLYNFVKFADVKKIVEQGLPDGDLYLPESGSGTRRAFDAASSSTVKWPQRVEQVPDYVEQFGGQSPFLTILSELQASKNSPNATPCQLMNQYALKAAAICKDGEKCGALQLVEFSVVIKLARDSGRSPNPYYIANPAECKVARALTQNIDSGCGVTGHLNEATHIMSIDVAPRAGISDFLACRQPEAPPPP